MFNYQRRVYPCNQPHRRFKLESSSISVFCPSSAPSWNHRPAAPFCGSPLQVRLGSDWMHDGHLKHKAVLSKSRCFTKNWWRENGEFVQNTNKTVCTAKRYSRCPSISDILWKEVVAIQPYILHHISHRNSSPNRCSTTAFCERKCLCLTCKLASRER